MSNETHSTGGDRRQALSLLESEYQELKRQRSIFAHSPNQEQALRLSTRMVEVAKAMSDANPTRNRLRNLEYARYYEAVSGCVVAQLSADFDGAQKCAAAAARAARSFRESSRFFPNFFFDEAEIASHEVYLEAVKSFRAGHFGGAADHFDKWLTLNRHRKAHGDTHYDSNDFHQQLCLVLDAIDRGLDCAAQWGALERALLSPRHSIYRTTRALWDHIEPLKTAATLGRDSFPGGRPMIELLLTKAREDWPLLSTSAPIQGKDRSAGLEEPLRLPAFVDIFHCLHEAGETWRYFLLQSFRNTLILKSDYESRLRRRLSSADSDQNQPEAKESFEIERLNDAGLIRYTRDLIFARSASDSNIYDKAVPLWFEARNAIRSADRSEAEERCRRFYTTLRSFPHVIRATSCEVMPLTGEDIHGAFRTHYRLASKRIWRYSPNDLTLETEQAIPTGSYAYLRPRWNRSLKLHYRVRNQLDLPLSARMPEWMILFERWAAGQGPVKAEAFLRWCNQIEPRWRSAALRLLSRLTFLEEEDIRELWTSLYRTRLPASVKGNRTRYVGLGRAAKSGDLQLYWLKQALSVSPRVSPSGQ